MMGSTGISPTYLIKTLYAKSRMLSWHPVPGLCPSCLRSSVRSEILICADRRIQACLKICFVKRGTAMCITFHNSFPNTATVWSAGELQTTYSQAVINIHLSVLLHFQPLPSVLNVQQLHPGCTSNIQLLHSWSPFNVSHNCLTIVANMSELYAPKKKHVYKLHINTQTALHSYGRRLLTYRTRYP